MKAHTQEFKNNIKTLGRELDSKITYTLNNEEIVLGNAQLNSITPHYEGDILKSVMKQLDIDSNVEIPVGTEVNYKFGVKTRNGKNLLESSLDRLKANNTSGTWNDNVYTYQGVSFTYNSDGSITANGTASTTIQFYISRTGGSYLYTTLESGSYYLTSHETTGANNTWKIQFADENQNSWNVHGTGNNKEVNLTLSQSTNIRAYVVVYSGKNPNGATFYPMIAKESGIDYEQYGMYEYLDYGNYIVKDIEKQEDTRSWKITCYDKMLYAMKDYEKIENKNQLRPMEVLQGQTRTSNGITMTFNYDGTIIVNGTATANMGYAFAGGGSDTTFRDELREILLNNTCYLSGCPEGGSDSTFRLQLYGYTASGTGSINEYGNGTNLSTFVNETANFNIGLYVANGFVARNLVFKPMIEINNKKTIYAPQFKYPVSLKKYLMNLSAKIGLEFKNTNFVNYDKQIQNELYVDSNGNSLNYTYRDVLDEIAGATASTICINENDELEVRYIYKNLPSEYTRVEYIEKNGGGTFSTGFTPTLNTEIQAKVELIGSSSNGNSKIYGTGNNDITSWYGVNSNNWRFGGTTPGGLVFNDVGIYEIVQNKTYLKINDKIYNYPSGASMSGTNTIEVGNTVNDNYIRYYYLKIFDEGLLVRDLIPCYRNNDNAVGFYDLINNVFYTKTIYTKGSDCFDIIDEEYLKDINVNFGEKYGPVNSVVFSRSAESDNIYRQDTTSITNNGLTEIKIVDNQILNGNNRDDFIDGVFNQLNGFEYYANDFSSTGIAYYDLCDRYNIRVDNNIYNCIMMNDELNITQGLVEQVHTDIPEKSETDYKKADSTDRRINETWIIANKQEGYIEALTSRTTSLEENTYTITQINDLIQNAESGITNTFSEAGGNNIFRNTGLWFENSGEDSQQNPYEFWEGVATRQTENNAINRNAIVLQNATFSQNQNVVNGYYTISFKYKKLVALANISININGNEFNLTGTDETEFLQTIEVQNQYLDVDFICDVSDGCEIYDLMVNSGQQKLAYSQNQNETTTDTVNISKGITITSSDTDVKFKADSDGIRTLDSSDNIITEFTDVGMTTGEATINGKSTIVGTFWQDINGQTWITRV